MAIERAAAMIAAALQGQRHALDRAVAQQRPGVEARYFQRGGPRVATALGELDLQACIHRRAERQCQMGLATVAADPQPAPVFGIADFPLEAGMPVAVVVAADGHVAVELGVAFGGIELQLANAQAGAGPGAGQIESAGGEHGLAALADGQLAHVHAVQLQVDRRLQVEGAAGVRGGGGAGRQVDLDAFGLQVEDMQALAQQRPQAQVQVRAGEHVGAFAVAIAHAAQVERAGQPSPGVLHGQRAVGRG